MTDDEIRDILLTTRRIAVVGASDRPDRPSYGVARFLVERGYDVTIVADCTSSRTATEHDFFCDVVFPLYGRAKTTTEVLGELMEPAT